MRKVVFSLVSALCFAAMIFGCSTDPATRHTQVLSTINSLSPKIGRLTYLFVAEAKEPLTIICGLQKLADSGDTDSVAKELNESLKKIWVKASTISNLQAQEAVLAINDLSSLLSLNQTSGYLLEDLKSAISGICTGVAMAQALALTSEIYNEGLDSRNFQLSAIRERGMVYIPPVYAQDAVIQ